MALPVLKTANVAFRSIGSITGCHDIQHNDTQHDDSHQNECICDTRHNDIQQNSASASVAMLNVAFYFLLC